MPSITQTIPNYVSGISEQPDELKTPGQLTVAKNVLPDVTQGLVKRPGGKLIGGNLGAYTNDSKWFHYYRDENEQYIGQIRHSDGELKMWRCNAMTINGVDYDAGSPVNVNYDSNKVTALKSYLTHTSGSPEDIQTLTLNDFTYITNRTKTVAMSTTVEPARPPEAFIELKKVAYANQYAVNLFDNNDTTTVTTATRISVVSSVLDTASTCPNVGTEILNISTGDSHGEDKQQIFRWQNLEFAGTNDFTYLFPQQASIDYDYEFIYCPPPWAANTLYRVGDLVTGDPNGSDVHQKIYKRTSAGTSGSTIPSGTSNTNWSVVSNSETYTAISSNTTTQLHDGKLCLRLQAHDLDCAPNATARAAFFTALINGFTNTTVNPEYADLPFTIENNNYEDSTPSGRFDIKWKGNGYYREHSSRFILRRLNYTYDESTTYYGMTLGGSDAYNTLPANHLAGDLIEHQAGNTATNNLAAGRSDLYFRLTNTGQAVPVDVAEVSTDDYICRYTTTVDLLHGGSGWQVGDVFSVKVKDGVHTIRVDKISTSKVQANLGLIRPTPTSFDTKTTVTAESILGDIRSQIIGTTDSGPNTLHDWRDANVEQIGNGIYITRPSGSFNITTAGNELLNVLSSEVKDVADLPKQCKHGYVVKVANSEAEEDDYYVKFIGELKTGGDPDDDNDYLDGNGVWEECPKPGRNVEFKTDTMPIVLIRTADGEFRVAEIDGGYYQDFRNATYSNGASNNDIAITLTNHGYTAGDLIKVEKLTSNDGTLPDDTYTVKESVNANSIKIETTSNIGINVNQDIKVRLAGEHPKWENALVGDKETNPEPSFVGKTINKMLFFRNRLVMLSDENIIMSRPGDFFNFWAKSAITYTATDNIDISCSSEFPAIVYDGIQVNSGLVLFTKNQQFMLTTDSDVLSPLTAKINALSSYNFNFKSNPISLGTTIAFLDNAGKYNRFWEMTAVLREGEPNVIEQSKAISKSFDSGIDMVANSRENQVIFFGKKGTSKLYGFRYYTTSAQRIQQAWFTWEVKGLIQHIAMLDDALFVIAKDGSSYTMQRFSIRGLEDSLKVTTNSIDYRIYLDNAKEISSDHSSFEYVADGDYTKFDHTAADFGSTDNLKVIGLGTADQTFNGSVEDATVFDDSGTSKIKIPGNWKTYVDKDGVTQTPTYKLVLGYNYDMEVQFPTIYLQQQSNEQFRSQIHSSLVVHRVKLSLGPSGFYQTNLTRIGKVDFLQDHESPLADNYNPNRVAVNNVLKKTIPVYEKNTNLTLTLKSTHPTPATLYSMTWEGDYTNKFYKSV